MNLEEKLLSKTKQGLCVGGCYHHSGQHQKIDYHTQPQSLCYQEHFFQHQLGPGFSLLVPCQAAKNTKASPYPGNQESLEHV